MERHAFGGGRPYALNFGVADIYGVQWNVPPYWVYGANTGGNLFVPNGAPAFEQMSVNTAFRFHDLVLSWDGNANMLYEFIDGAIIASYYMEYAQAPTYLDQNGVSHVQGMHLMIANTPVPVWMPGGSATSENDGIANGWTMTVQEIAAWNGLVLDPSRREPE